MRKILLVTMYSDNNFGNRLQNYALQTVLTNMGYDVDNIKYDTHNGLKGTAIMFCKRLFRLFHIKFKSINGDYLNALVPRIKKFERFNDNYISNIINLRYFDTSLINTDNYAFAVTGSDQVWHNWYNDTKEMDMFYLAFMPKAKRIAYAPSFGFSVFPEHDLEMHKSYLSGYEKGKISCREQTGTNIIKAAVGLYAPTVPDPTLLLGQADWRRLLKKPDYEVPTKYVLSYFLKEKRSFNTNEPIIEVCDYTQKNYFATSPDEFLWLVANADHVYTNSFHACVFAILFHKDFTVYKKSNEDMFDRIQTLLNGTGLEQCIESDAQHNIDWEQVDAVVAKRREFGLDFLRKALQVENNSR